MTRLSMPKNTICASATFIIGGTMLLFSLFLEAAANEHNIVDNEIINNLNSMGYRNVSLDECVIEFHREVTPIPENDYSTSYYRRINLRNIILSELGEVEEAPFNERLGIYYRFGAPFNDLYKEKIPSYLFKRWVRENFPSVDWPYNYPTNYDEFAPIIERELRLRVPNMSEMNIWVLNAKYGEVTEFPSHFWMNFDDEKILQSFRELLLLYAHEHAC